MKTVYRGFTPEQLQSQYSARAAVPEHPQIFQRWRRMSVDFRALSHAELNIPYGESPREKVDLFLPSTENPPLLVFIHGGYWQAMDKGDFSFIARELVARGIAVALPGTISVRPLRWIKSPHRCGVRCYGSSLRHPSMESIPGRCISAATPPAVS